MTTPSSPPTLTAIETLSSNRRRMSKSPSPSSVKQVNQVPKSRLSSALNRTFHNASGIKPAQIQRPVQKESIIKHPFRQTAKKSIMIKNQALPNPPLAFPSLPTLNSHLASTHERLSNILTTETAIFPLPVPQRNETLLVITPLLHQYVGVYKSLNHFYDQVLHPQKRILLRQTLDLVLIRLLELRQVLVNAESSEFFYFDEFTGEKLTPESFDIPIPLYYYHDPADNLVARDSWIRTIKNNRERAEAERLEMERRVQEKLLEDENLTKVVRMETEESLDLFRMKSFEEAQYVDQAAVILIQTIERARQGKMRFEVAKYLHDEEVKAALKRMRAKQTTMEIGVAVEIIQKTVRGFLARVRVKRMREEELELLGLKWTMPSSRSLRGLEKLKMVKNAKELERAEEFRRKIRREHQKMFEEAQVAILSRLRFTEAPQMAEDLKHAMRSYMLEVRETTNKFPEMPKAEFIAGKFSICPVDVKDEEPDETKDSKKKPEKKEEKKKKKEDKISKKQKVVEEPVQRLEVSQQIDKLQMTTEEYQKVWLHRRDQHNPEQRHENVFIEEEKRKLISDEVREQVEIAMKAELQLMKYALERKKGKKGKKGKGRGKKGKSKKSKKKKTKDMTPDSTIEQLFQELFDNGIIREYPQTRLDDLIGPHSIINGEIRSYFSQGRVDPQEKEERRVPGDENPLPSFGDVKKVVKEVCILPLGSKLVHEASPHTKSVLICGPEGCGKKSLVNAICTELQATLFDLTAANIAGKYPGKPGLKMLMHLIEKVGKAVAPVVIKIEGCEKTYSKKIAKTDKTEPKRLKKQLTKMLKSFNPGDQMILIGLSSEPWMCPFKVMKKDFYKVVYIPKPDFGSRLKVWSTLLLPYEKYLHPDINFSLLAKLSDGWTSGTIKHVVSTVLQNNRVPALEKQQDEDETNGKVVRRPPSVFRKRVVRMDNILDELSNFDPVFLEQEKVWNAWFAKTPLQRSRLAMQAGFNNAEKKPGKKKAAAAKKGKKKKKEIK